MMVKLLNYAQFLLVLCVVLGIGYISYHHGEVHGTMGMRNSSVVTLANYDGDGHVMDVTYPVPPRRVVVTYPGATELLIALGAEQHVIATVAPYGVEPSSLAQAYDAIPKISAPFVPTKEELITLEPDLIMGWNHHFSPNALGDVYKWQQRGVATYIVPATIRRGAPTLEETVYPFIDDVGRIFDIQLRANQYKESLQTRVQAVLRRAESNPTQPTVMILQTYGNSTYSVYGDSYIIYDIVRKAGGIPVTSRMLQSVGPERILGFNPDYIVLVASRMQTDEDQFWNESIQMVQQDVNLSSLRAVQEGHIIPVDFSAVNNGNGRIVDVLETISDGLHLQ